MQLLSKNNFFRLKIVIAFFCFIAIAVFSGNTLFGQLDTIVPASPSTWMYPDGNLAATKHNANRS
jgi:hypothetical protein